MIDSEAVKASLLADPQTRAEHEALGPQCEVGDRLLVLVVKVGLRREVYRDR